MNCELSNFLRLKWGEVGNAVARRPPSQKLVKRSKYVEFLIEYLFAIVCSVLCSNEIFMKHVIILACKKPTYIGIYSVCTYSLEKCEIYSYFRENIFYWVSRNFALNWRFGYLLNSQNSVTLCFSNFDYALASN